MIGDGLGFIVLALEIAGIGAIVIGAVVSLGIYLRGLLAKVPHDACFKALRANLGRSILLGLGFWWPPTSSRPWRLS
jgi:uncharacterized membrane protein